MPRNETRAGIICRHWPMMAWVIKLRLWSIFGELYPWNRTIRYICRRWSRSKAAVPHIVGRREISGGLAWASALAHLCACVISCECSAVDAKNKATARFLPCRGFYYASSVSSSAGPSSVSAASSAALAATRLTYRFARSWTRKCCQTKTTTAAIQLMAATSWLIRKIP